MSIRAVLVVSTALAVCLSLSACDPGDPAEPTSAPTPTVSPSPTPEPSATPAIDLGPSPIIGVTCDALASAASIAATIGSPVAPSDAGISQMGAYPFLAPAYVVRSLGGIACEWNNGESYSSSAGTNPAYIGVRVQILPNAGSQWTRYESMYGGPAASATYCFDNAVGTNCSTNVLVGAHWLEIELHGAASEPAANALVGEIAGALGGAGAGALPWTAPAGTIVLGAECTDTLPATAVGILLGVGVPLEAGHGGGGWSLRAGADVIAGVLPCSYNYEGQDAGVGSFRALPAGAWAWHEVRSSITSPAVPERVELAGQEAGDEAWVRCSAGNDQCVLDLVVGGNWVEVYLYPGTGTAPANVTVDKREGILRIGQAILGEVRA